VERAIGELLYVLEKLHIAVVCHEVNVTINIFTEAAVGLKDSWEGHLYQSIQHSGDDTHPLDNTVTRDHSCFEVMCDLCIFVYPIVVQLTKQFWCLKCENPRKMQFWAHRTKDHRPYQAPCSFMIGIIVHIDFKKKEMVVLK
jgi:hypothetical protein